MCTLANGGLRVVADRGEPSGCLTTWSDSEPTRLADHLTNGLGGKSISIRGVVQGVGFRPFVYRLAHKHGLAGWVLNHSGGVDVEVEGPVSALESFVSELKENPPPLARISSVEAWDRAPTGCAAFEIRESRKEVGRYQLISPDIATCPDCLRELLDPGDRRYRYPFVNCTNCGPRFTIIADIPYDRPNTTMRQFKMCDDCQREYDDPLDRRFHAQPNACPVCGPHVWLVIPGSGPGGLRPTMESETGSTERPVADEILQTARLLRRGAIAALKGLGGFHLACDATNAAAVVRLRARKGRPQKPLAVMMATLEQVRRHCRVSRTEQELLTSRECPIVLLPWLEESKVARNVAPAYRRLGVMLPYTPLHHVLLRDAGHPLVMTSGNLSEEPICQSNEEAQERLSQIADAFLLHNREIYARYDDSVQAVYDTIVLRAATVQQTQPGAGFVQTIRRSRGHAPFPITLSVKTRPTLAVGAELKNTFCITRDRYAFLSQHIGDMENLETLEHFETSIELLKQLFRIEPELIACDLHPDYLATRLAQDQSASRDLRLEAVQHHHAHIASCLADNGWQSEDDPVIGVAWDGTGYGSDGWIWGGEWLVAHYQGFRRVGHLEYLPLAGGDTAIRNPYRIAAGYLIALGLSLAPSLASAFRSQAELTLFHQQVERGVNTPLTSSAGRLFDAVSALLGVCQRATYEAQAAIELEQATGSWMGIRGYPWDADRWDGNWVVRLRPMFEALLAETLRGTSAVEISARFHQTMATLIVDMCQRVRRDTGLETVALSGGCFQNRVLLSQTMAGLREVGFRTLVHHKVPANDGGLSLGQAVIANAWHSDGV
jgi:hydrogenase maturation protein HypF